MGFNIGKTSPRSMNFLHSFNLPTCVAFSTQLISSLKANKLEQNWLKTFWANWSQSSDELPSVIKNALGHLQNAISSSRASSNPRKTCSRLTWVKVLLSFVTKVVRCTTFQKQWISRQQPWFQNRTFTPEKLNQNTPLQLVSTSSDGFIQLSLLGSVRVFSICVFFNGDKIGIGDGTTVSKNPYSRGGTQLSFVLSIDLKTISLTLSIFLPAVLSLRCILDTPTQDSSFFIRVFWNVLSKKLLQDFLSLGIIYRRKSPIKVKTPNKVLQQILFVNDDNSR